MHTPDMRKRRVPVNVPTASHSSKDDLDNTNCSKLNRQRAAGVEDDQHTDG